MDKLFGTLLTLILLLIMALLGLLGGYSLFLFQYPAPHSYREAIIGIVHGGGGVLGGLLFFGVFYYALGKLAS